MRVVGGVESPSRFLARAGATQPDVAVVDASVATSGLTDLLGRLAEGNPATKVLFVSETQDAAVLLDALDAGALGVVTRDSCCRQLVAAVRAVHRGEAFVPPQMLGALLSQLIGRRRGRETSMRKVSQLSPREREVLGLLARGADTRVIASTLCISHDTARTHVQNVLRRLGVHSRLEAVALVSVSGWSQ